MRLPELALPQQQWHQCLLQYHQHVACVLQTSCWQCAAVGKHGDTTSGLPAKHCWVASLVLMLVTGAANQAKVAAVNVLDLQSCKKHRT